MYARNTAASRPLVAGTLIVLALGALIALACAAAVARRGRTGATPTAAAVASPRFVNVAAAAGLMFRYDNGRNGMSTMLEQNGSGCALLDYNGDGWLDAYLLNGRDLYGRGIVRRNALYENRGDGTFVDVTERVGVPGTGYGLGVAVADYDNDGDPDLYLCQWGRNALYRNQGNGRFEDVTQKAGVGGLDFGEPFHTGAAWFDYDRDGFLDLFVCSYVKFRQDGLRYCTLAGDILSNCPPSVYDGTPSLLYHNNGDGTFTNVTKKAGVFFPHGKALSVMTCDVDEDGWTDLFVGNDGTENWLLRNNRDGTFTNRAGAAGVAFAQDGASIATMGIDSGDFLNVGRPGLFAADFSKRPDHLWRGEPNGFFTEVSAPSGVGDAGFDLLGFGAGFLDYDNDGWLDLFIANGHVYPEVERQAGARETYLQNNQLFRNEKNGRFREITSEAGSAFGLRHAGRGAAFGDIDNDGNVDILINNNDGPPVLARNTGAAGSGRRHFVSFRLVGDGKRSNRDAVGARITVTAPGGLRQLRDVKSGGSYLSSSDPRVHFGLDTTAAVERIQVRWPSGRTQTWTARLPADAFYVLREGAAAPEPAIARRHVPK